MPTPLKHGFPLRPAPLLKILRALLLGLALCSCEKAGQTGPRSREAFTREERQHARFRQRRLIFNNDGNDIVVDNLGPVRIPKRQITTPEELLARRTIPLKGTEVDTIAYCTTVGTFGAFSHRTTVAETFLKQEGTYRFNPMPEFLKQNTDPLRIVTGYCNANGIEVFWDMRMNDTHDANPEYGNIFFSRFKIEHPEFLFGTRETPPKVGLWSAVDYGEAKVRDFAYRIIAEAIEHYPIDGIELDFWRHPIFFKRSGDGLPLRQEDLDAMTGLIRRIRQKLDEEGKRRGRYLLLAIKVPDSTGYCKAIGLDIERWMARDMVDLLIPGGYFQLNPWAESVALGKRYGVPVYACLAEPRIREPEGQREHSTLETLRARALAAWSSGVDGIEMFNHFDALSPLWKELGSPDRLQALPKTYFVCPQGMPRFGQASFRPYVESEAYIKVPTLSPNHPETIQAGQSRSYELYLGDDLKNEPGLTARLGVKPLRASGGASLEMEWDGVSLNAAGPADGLITADLDSKTVTPGRHTITLSLPKNAARAEVTVKDAFLTIAARKN